MVQLSSKAKLRKWAKQERSQLDMKSLSKLLVQKLQKTDEYKNSTNIMIFYPLKEEVDLLELLEDDSKNFYLPKIKGEELLCCPYNKNDELCFSCFKTKEPLSKSVDKKLLDLVIVPALAVDKNNYRLGYGGGFYDRFLKDADCKKLVCIPKNFILTTVFPQEHDIKIDLCITA